MATGAEPDWQPRDALSVLFFRGRYDAVLEEAIHLVDTDGHPAVIGALAMVGRLEEAEAIASLHADRSVCSKVAMTQFVLCMGQCHAGRYPDALRTAATLLRSYRRGTEFQRFFAHQAAAMTRYFLGRMRLARRHVLHALACSWQTSLGYPRLLALELSGHISVQLGDLYKGLRTLEDARNLATGLGYESNGQTIELSMLTYALRIPGERRKAREHLVGLVQDEHVSRFARRNALMSLALEYIVSGRASKALDVLQKADRFAQRNEDLRGSVRANTTRALWASVTGQDALAESLWADLEQKTVGESRDFVEFCYFAVLVGRRIPVVHLQQVERTTGLLRSKIALHLTAEEERKDWLDWPAVALFPDKTRALAPQLVECDALGLLPRIQGLPPGRRIWLDTDRWIVEDRGDIVLVEQPIGNGHCLLEELSRQAHTKESLFQAIWQQTYSPRLHDATLQKLVSRVRKILGPRGTWIVSTDDGYELREGVSVVHVSLGAAVEGPVDGESTQDLERDPLATMRRLGSFTSRDLARAFRISKATANRLIHKELQDGHIARMGSGKNTSYRVSTD